MLLKISRMYCVKPQRSEQSHNSLKNQHSSDAVDLSSLYFSEAAFFADFFAFMTLGFFGDAALDFFPPFLVTLALLGLAGFLAAGASTGAVVSLGGAGGAAAAAGFAGFAFPLAAGAFFLAGPFLDALFFAGAFLAAVLAGFAGAGLTLKEPAAPFPLL